LFFNPSYIHRPLLMTFTTQEVALQNQGRNGVTNSGGRRKAYGLPSLAMDSAR
jgi:hypothetical protein